MKKFKMSVVALVLALLIPSSTFASSGWDYLGEETLWSYGAESDVYASTGGDYKICRAYDSDSSAEAKVELWEYDPESSNDKVGTRYLAPGECGYFWDIGKFVDGGNEAEFFAKSRHSSVIHLSFYD